ncbi:MAG: hypothetical protein FWB85_05930 [Chitinispirillia bacterium]|nr:hypothetical protein [Chitinispirillia bacterium]
MRPNLLKTINLKIALVEGSLLPQAERHFSRLAKMGIGKYVSTFSYLHPYTSIY